MDINGLLNKFLGTNGQGQAAQGSGATPNNPSNNFSGMAGGALAGGLMALVLGDKSIRKFVGKAATVGGMAVVGGLAYKALKDWQDKKSIQASNNKTEATPTNIPSSFLPNSSVSLELTLIKAMISAAKADGQIDSTEQEKIFKQSQSANLSAEEKGLIFDLMSRPITVSELANSVSSIEHKSEVYLVSCLACLGDNPEERKYLANLSEALALPAELVAHLENQVKSATA
jgi:uncharacterized membrane protein YebE (DUF533 family)